MQMGLSFSLKKASPSYLARTGNCSTTDNLILQFLSWLSSVRAGMIDWARCSIPNTLFKSSKRLKRFSLTSELSSLSRAKNMGRTCSFVACFSMIGQRGSRFSARAALTYWKLSVYNFFKVGTILAITVGPSRSLQKPARRPTAAVLTSDSLSARKEQK